MSDLDELVTSIPRTRGAVQVRKRSYRGNEFVDVRAWYFDAEDGTLRPGKGVTVRPNEIREVATALLQLAECFEAEAN